MSKITEIADHDGIISVSTKLSLAAYSLAKELCDYAALGDNASQEVLENSLIKIEDNLAEVELLSKEAVYLYGYDRTIYDHIKEEKLNKELTRIAKEPKGTKFREYTCPFDKKVMCDMTDPCATCTMSKGAIRV